MDGNMPLPAMVDAATFRAGMARLAGAVNIVTTLGPAGPAGFTATAVCSVSAEPPMLLVCLNRASSAAAAFDAAAMLCVNTIAADQAEVAQVFGGRTPMAERFAGGGWLDGAGGVPRLAGALVAFEGRIVARHPAGTHQVLFCEVTAVHQGPAGRAASLYWERGFHRLSPG
jgi:flavin reductase